VRSLWSDSFRPLRLVRVIRRVERLLTAVPRDILGLSLEALEGPAFQFMATGSGGNLIRYQVAIDRSRQRALHELQRLQARRRGEAVAAPSAVDVSHSIDAAVGELHPSVSAIAKAREMIETMGQRDAAETCCGSLLR
jgi:hypothetical protein